MEQIVPFFPKIDICWHNTQSSVRSELMIPECDVILSFRDAESTLGPAVRSILEQSHENLRLIAIDDGSSDRSLQVLNSFKDSRVQVVTNDRTLGLPASLNRGVGLSTAPFIARMDADDISHPSRLAEQLKILENRKELDLVGSAVVCMDSKERLLGQRVYPTEHSEIIQRPYRSIPIAHPTWCGRREWFMKNPYDSKCLKSQDQALLRSARHDSRFANLPQPLLAYRESTAIRPMATLRSRRFLARDILRSATSERRPFAGLLGATGVLSRWSLDVLVWASGNPRFATHRFQPLPHELQIEWQSILGDSHVTAPRG